MRNTLATQSLFELSHAGRRATELPACDVPTRRLDELLPADSLAETPPELPEITEPDVVRQL